jgi:hypothetical protein
MTLMQECHKPLQRSHGTILIIKKHTILMFTTQIYIWSSRNTYLRGVGATIQNTTVYFSYYFNSLILLKWACITIKLKTD